MNTCSGTPHINAYCATDHWYENLSRCSDDCWDSVCLKTPPPAYADGGYPIVYYDAHCDELCANCAGKIRDTQKVTLASGVYWEGAPIECAECGCTIESAYGDPDAERVPS